MSRLRDQVDISQNRFHENKRNQEIELVARAEQIVRERMELEKQLDRVKENHKTLDKTYCELKQEQIELVHKTQKLKSSVTQWIEQMKRKEYGEASLYDLNNWREMARQIKAELDTIDFGSTKSWLEQNLIEAKEIVDNIFDLFDKRFESKTLELEINRLDMNEQDQEFLVNYYLNQLYLIRNATRNTANELQAAEVKLKL